MEMNYEKTLTGFSNLLIFSFKYIKMSKTSSAKYYQDNKERLQKNPWKISVFLKKKKKRQYGRERYKNLSEDEKRKLIEYRKKYYKMKKIPYYSYEKLFSFGKNLELN